MASSRGPGVRFPPPTIFAAAFGVGALLERFVERIRLLGGTASPRVIVVAGLALLVLGAAVAISGVIAFRRADTSIMPFRPANAFVQNGPFRFTRNPMYLGMTLAYAGGALMLNMAWPLVLLPVAMYAMYRFVIRREERYLTERFGDTYVEFTRRVRRWI
jgi:protein-S-isoprenylcysteine O-methyltransferase Ste14